MKTRMAEGRLSPKTIIAAVLPAVGTLIAIIIQYAITHELDKAELVTALTGFSSALVAGLGAWAAEPGVSEIVPGDA